MSTHKSAEKRIRQSRKARLRNRMWKSQIRTARNKLEKAVENGQKDILATLYREYVSLIDRAKSRKVIPKNNASRKKATATKKIKTVQVSSSTAKEGDVSHS